MKTKGDVISEHSVECGPMLNMMATLGIQVAPSVENDEE